MFTAKNLLSTVFAASMTLTSALDAQELHGQVTRNPNDTVTYTIDIDGPPNGTSFVLISPFLLQQPFQLPGFFHQLWIDPTFMIASPAIAIDQNGHGCFGFDIPVQAVPGQAYYFQTLNIDMAGNLAFSQNVLMLAQNMAPIAAPPVSDDSFAMGWESGVGAGTTIWGDPGTTYEITIRDANGNIVATHTATVGANGNTGYQNFALPGLGAGYTYEIWRDEGGGALTQRWTGTF